MPRLDYKRCKGCDRPASEVGELSHERLCSSCGAENLYENVAAMVMKSGPGWLKWRRAMAASVGGILAADLAQLDHTGAP